MDFVIQWLWYLLAFVVGSLVAWLITVAHDQADERRGSARRSSRRTRVGSGVMQNVNWWLMALAFVLGLVLTLALLIRRVKREVPEYATLAAGAGPRARGRGAAGVKCGRAGASTTSRTVRARSG